MDNREYTTGTKVFEEWEIVRKLGEGANGKVFEVHKTDFGITTKAALKVIRIPRSENEVKTAMSEGMDRQSVTTYFQGFVNEIVKEISVMSQLKGHSNIVSYEDHSVLQHSDGIGWDILIRMELLTPLTDYLLKNQSQVNEDMVLRLAQELCGALVFCQSKKMVHRDIKPENIFVSENGHFKLGDFGIARTVEKTTGGLSKKGTESYMAPEVYLGKPYGADVDLYSLGLVLYKLLNGNRLPFLPPYPQPITYSDREEAISRRMQGEALPRPQNASQAFADIILKACEFDRGKRYRTAEEMLTALKQLEEQPKKQKSAEKPEKPEKPEQQETPAEQDSLKRKENAPTPEDRNHASKINAIDRENSAESKSHAVKKSGNKGIRAGIILAVCVVAVMAIVFWGKGKLPIGSGSNGQSEVWSIMDSLLTQAANLTDEQIAGMKNKDTATQWKEKNEELGAYEKLQQANVSIDGIYTGYARYKDAGLVKVTFDAKTGEMQWETTKSVQKEASLSEYDKQMIGKWKLVANKLWEGHQLDGIDYRKATMDEAAKYWKEHGLRFSDEEGNWHDDIIYIEESGGLEEKKIEAGIADVPATEKQYGYETELDVGYIIASQFKGITGVSFMWMDSVSMITSDYGGAQYEDALEKYDQVMPYPAGLGRAEEFQNSLNKLGVTQEMLQWLRDGRKEEVYLGDEYSFYAEDGASIWKIEYTEGESEVSLDAVEYIDGKTSRASVSWEQESNANVKTLDTIGCSLMDNMSYNYFSAA